MKRNTVKLTESQLHKVIKESVKRVIKEMGETAKGQERLGALTARKFKQAKNDFSQGKYNSEHGRKGTSIMGYAQGKRQFGKNQKEMDDAYWRGYNNYNDSED